MFRSVSYGPTIQDQYNDISSTDHKFKLVAQMMQKASANQRDNEAFYVNFLSMASGWRPYVSSKEVNSKVNNFLNKQTSLSSLGLIYMDFPGPSLIQSIYRTNFYYTDEALRTGVLGPNIDHLKLKPIYEFDNFISLDTSDNPRAYQNLWLELYIDDSLVKKILLPKDFNAAEFTLTLDKTQLKLGKNIFLKAYKKTPDNGWYPARIYNQEELANIIVQKHPFLIEQNALLKKISNAQQTFLKKHPKISEFLENQYIPRLKKLNPHQDNSLGNFQKIMKNWENIEKYLENLTKLLEVFKNSFSNIQKLPLTNLFNSTNTEKIKNLDKQITSSMNDVFNQASHELINPLNLTSLNQRIMKINALVSWIKTTFDSIHGLNLFKEINEFQSSNPEFDFAKGNILHALNEKINELNQLFENNLLNNNTSEVIATMQEKSKKSGSELNRLKSKIDASSAFLQKCKDFFKQPKNESLLTFFKQDIIQSLENNNLDSENITQKARTFLLAFNQLRELVQNQSKILSSSLKMNYKSSNIQTYVTLIDQVQSALTKKDPKTLTISYIYDNIDRLKDMQTKIQNNADILQRINEQIQKDSSLSDLQKKYFTKNLLRIDNLDERNSSPLINSINKIKDVYNSLDHLTSLNRRQKKSIRDHLQTMTDIPSLVEELKVGQDLNQGMKELSAKLNLLNDYQKMKGFLILNPDKRNEFTQFFNKTKTEARDTNLTQNSVIKAIEQLNHFHDIFAKQKSLEEARKTVEESADLYQFEQAELLLDLNKVANFDDLTRWYKKHKEWSSNAIRKKDLITFPNLNALQLQKILDVFINAKTREDYNRLRSDFTCLNESIKNGFDLANKLKGIESSELYLKNSVEQQNKIKESLSLLNDLLVNSTNYNSVNKQIALVQNDYKNLIDNFHTLESISLKKQAIDEYEQTYQAAQLMKKELTHPQNIYDSLKQQITDFLAKNTLNVQDYNLPLETIKKNKNELQKQITDWKRSQQIIEKQYNDKIRKQKELLDTFNTYAESLIFNLSTQKSNALPSTIEKDDLKPNQDNPDYQIVNLSMKPNDDTGVLEISYEVKKGDLVYEKNQLINGFMTNKEMQEQQFLKESKKRLDEIIHKTNEKIDSFKDLNNEMSDDEVLQTAMTTLIDTCDQAKQVQKNIDSTNKTINDAVRALILANEKLDEAIQKHEINERKNQLGLKINNYISEVQTWASEQWEEPITSFIKDMQMYAKELDNANTWTEEQWLLITDNINKKYADLSAQTDDFYNHLLTTLTQNVSFVVDKQKHFQAIRDINKEDLIIQKDNKLQIDIKNLLADEKEHALTVNFDSVYKGYKINSSFVITNITLDNEKHLVINEEVTDVSHEKPVVLSLPDVPHETITTNDENTDQDILPDKTNGVVKPVNKEPVVVSLPDVPDKEITTNDENTDHDILPDKTNGVVKPVNKEPAAVSLSDVPDKEMTTNDENVDSSILREKVVENKKTTPNGHSNNMDTKPIEKTTTTNFKTDHDDTKKDLIKNKEPIIEKLPIKHNAKLVDANDKNNTLVKGIPAEKNKTGNEFNTSILPPSNQKQKTSDVNTIQADHKSHLKYLWLLLLPLLGSIIILLIYLYIRKKRKSKT
ncbi:lipoprotein 17-related variable surface protein [Ureaplasma zalophigenitalium]|uniref:Lipoprotein 17-related variable surface protein n=1 Tax=Ureaplasma zalophigenitalium TaxID=907723 RepID=A0ABT3BP86_9BACT|nr:lipoprotein 17-related variable surface protein [Ureaplasma zalophigenitalium]MCV3754056.1 lipoprotein 17-related variable surface protein [Ureaplasma zalophigenitalium]